MKNNEKTEELTPEQMKLIEDFFQRIDLQNLDTNEKIALNYIFSKDFKKHPVCDFINEDYPNVTLTLGHSRAAEQGLQSLILLYILKRNLIFIENQEVLIQQNQQVIKQNQQIVNLLKEIKDK